MPAHEVERDDAGHLRGVQHAHGGFDVAEERAARLEEHHDLALALHAPFPAVEALDARDEVRARDEALVHKMERDPFGGRLVGARDVHAAVVHSGAMRRRSLFLSDDGSPRVLRRKVQVFVYRHNPGLEVLILRRARASKEGVGEDWQPVTGNVERHEQIRAAAIRECAEEIACDVDPEPLGLTFTYEKKGQRFHETIYAARVPRDEVVETGEEHTAHEWQAPDKAAAKLHWPEQKKALDALVKRYG